MAGPSPIRRFALIAHPRSGSSWLAQSLAEHDDILMFGEVFNADPTDRAEGVRHGIRYETYLVSHPAPWDPAASSAEFADELFRLAEETEHKAVGFKLHYEQCRGGGLPSSVWTLIQNDPTIAIVHLYRADLLRSYVSLKIALASNEWVSTLKHPGGERTGYRLSVNIPAFRVYVRQSLRFQAQVRTWRQGRPYIELEYEETIASDPDGTCNRVCAALGQSPIRRRSYFMKQKDFSAEEVVSNYDAARECLRAIQAAS